MFAMVKNYRSPNKYWAAKNGTVDLRFRFNNKWRRMFSLNLYSNFLSLQRQEQRLLVQLWGIWHRDRRSSWFAACYKAPKKLPIFSGITTTEWSIMTSIGELMSAPKQVRQFRLRKWRKVSLPYFLCYLLQIFITQNWQFNMRTKSTQEITLVCHKIHNQRPLLSIFLKVSKVFITQYD